MFTLAIIAGIFLLSLVGAVVLFKFFVSTAIIKGKTYQAGGEIAGFILLYSVLYGSYYKIEEKDYSEYKAIAEEMAPKPITGRITPYKKHTKVILAVKETDPDSSGRFRLQASAVDPVNNDVRLYVITEDQFIPYDIYSLAEMKDVEISISP
jgi:hypothetical protein